jgi:hypothetical protein
MIRAIALWAFSKLPPNVRFALALHEIAASESYALVDIRCYVRGAPRVIRVGAHPEIVFGDRRRLH